MTEPVVEVTVEFAFEAAHWLPHVHETHKCRRMHGHSYKVAVTLAGEVVSDETGLKRYSHGMVMDYAHIKTVVNPVIKKLDHTTLNDWLPNPTCENLCIGIWDAIAEYMLGLLAVVTVRETDHAYCTYRGPKEVTTDVLRIL